MTADLSPAERATAERFDAAPDAEESLRERVAEALYLHEQPGGRYRQRSEWAKDMCRAMADAAIAVMRGER